MSSIGVARLGSSVRQFVARIPGAGPGWRRRSVDRPFLRVLTGPLPVLVVGAVMAVAQASGRAWDPIDADQYWLASSHLDHLYAYNWTSATDYASPPTIAQLWAPFHVLPFEVVLVAWITFLFGCLWYAARAWALPIVVLGLVGIGTGIPDISAPLAIILLGNVSMLMTAGVVATVRHPAAVAIPALTKIGPGTALGWHVFRREWRAAGIGVASCLIVFGISFVLSPSAWIDWVGWIARNYGSSPIPLLPIPFLIRFPVGVAIVAIAARTDRRWLVPIGAGLCIPADYGAGFLTVWVGSLGLLGQRRDPEASAIAA